tara:strand:- start:540 stop:758 length:219 start_codon:yes stop_codon:yes gene_type:complete
MDKIIYTRGTYSKEVQKIELDVTENLDVHEFKLICKRLACALGYSSNSVEEAFGNNYGNESTSKNIKQILKG